MRSKFFYAVVALMVMFSACNKDSFTPVAGEDDVTVEVKGFQKLGDASGEHGDIAFSWNGITASDFASLPTPPFNNFQQLLGTGITVFRWVGEVPKTPDFSDPKQKFGNGNDPVYLWFTDDAALNENNKVNKDEVLVFYLGVRYKAGNNVIFEFDVENCIQWCADNGPISLQWKDFTDVNLGDVTQVRIGPVMPKIKPDKPNPCPDGDCPTPPQPDPPCVLVTIQGIGDLSVFCSENKSCPLVTAEMVTKKFLEEYGELDLDESQEKFFGWLYLDGKPFVSRQVCEDLTLITDIRKFVIVTVVDEKGNTQSTETIVSNNGNCPRLTADMFPHPVTILSNGISKKFMGWLNVTLEGVAIAFEDGNYCGALTLAPDLKLPPTVTVLEQDETFIEDFYLTWDNNDCPTLLKSALDKYIADLKTVDRQLFVGWLYKLEGGTWTEFNAAGISSDCKNITVKPKFADFVGYTVKSYSGTCISNIISNTYQAYVVLRELYAGGIEKEVDVIIRPRWGGTKLHGNQLDNVKLVESQDDRNGRGGN